MPCAFIRKYLSEKDQNGVKVAEWAEQTAPGSDVARCKFCDTKVDFKAGVHKLLSHSETVKHRENTPETSETVKQVTIEQALDKTASVRAKEWEIKEAANFLKIKLIRSASRHMVPFKYLECIVDVFKEG